MPSIYSLIRRWAVLLPALALPALVGSCGGSSQSVSGEFVGRAANSTALVAIVTNGSDVRAYVCDGTPDGQLTVSEWFKGTKDGDTLDLDSLSGIGHITAQFTPTRVTGSIAVLGSPTLTFDAAPAVGDSGFYLYKHIDGGVLRWEGWIVQTATDLRGSQVTPARTSLNVSFDLTTGTAQVPGVGTVRPVKLIVGNVTQGFNGCLPQCI